MSQDNKPRGNKNIIDWEDCEKCGVGQLYSFNDLEDGNFYDSDRVFCETCGDVGYTSADETCIVEFDYMDNLEIKLEAAQAENAKLKEQVKVMREALEIIADREVESHTSLSLVRRARAALERIK